MLNTNTNIDDYIISIEVEVLEHNRNYTYICSKYYTTIHCILYKSKSKRVDGAK